MAEANLYLPTVAWRTSISNVILLTEETTELVATYRVTVDPIDINEPGGLTGEAEDIDANNYYLKDFLGHTFKIIDVGTGTVDISDDFRTGHGAVTGRMGIIYKSVGGGTSPYLAPVYYKYLDASARDYSRRFELDILWKNAGIKDGIITNIYVEPDPTFPIDYLHYDKDGVKTYITDIPKADGVVAGGHISWLGGLQFQLDPTAWYKAGDLYTIETSTTILDVADATYPRIDVLVVNTAKEFTFVKGTPSANPQKPTINPLTEIELTEVYIAAGATVPEPEPTNEIIYNENIEWTATGSGVVINADSTAQHYQGSKSIEVGSIGNFDYIQFQAGETFNTADWENIIANLMLKSKLDTRKCKISVVFLLDNVAINNPTDFAIAGNTLTWQNLTLPLSRINFFGTSFNQVRFYFYKTTGGNITGFYLDYIKLEIGIVPPVLNASVVLTGDVLGNGVTGIPIPTNLKIVNANIGTYGDANNSVTINVDAKGRILSVTESPINAGITWVTAPATKTSAGTAGQIAKDTNYVYICTSDNVWKRIAMVTNWV